jgi:hypothetical protein
MSSIGLIVRSTSDVEDLEANWIPESLGARVALRELLVQLGGESRDRVDRYSFFSRRGLWLELEIDEDDPPRSLTVAGVFSDNEMNFLLGLCERLSARFYDSGEGRFAF